MDRATGDMGQLLAKPSIRPRIDASTQGPAPSQEPVRTCVGCRQRRPASELVRLVAPDGRLGLGAGAPGRGAWLCRHDVLACFDVATKSGRWSRALRRTVDPASYAGLRQQLAHDTGRPVQ